MAKTRGWEFDELMGGRAGDNYFHFVYLQDHDPELCALIPNATLIASAELCEHRLKLWVFRYNANGYYFVQYELHKGRRHPKLWHHGRALQTPLEVLEIVFKALADLRLEVDAVKLGLGITRCAMNFDGGFRMLNADPGQIRHILESTA